MSVKVTISKINITTPTLTLNKITGNRFWDNPKIAIYAKHNLLLEAKKGIHLVGYWLLPVELNNDEILIRRSVRILPYCAPNIVSVSNLERRSIILEMLNTLQGYAHAISLPLAPGFNDAGICSTAGILVEWRHTHIFQKENWGWKKYPGKVKNSIQHAKKKIIIQYCKDIKRFNFQRAIVASSEEERQIRREFANHLLKLGLAYMIIASNNNEDIGGAFIAYDNISAYLLHMWFDRNTVRGVPSLLIDESANLAFHHIGCELFDLEGSILARVDKFISSFNALITPYGYIHWHRNPSSLAKECLASKNIPGREVER